MMLISVMDAKKVSRITLGTAQLGFDYGISGNKLGDVPSDILNFALQSGIDMLDTAYAYGKSEAVIGEYLKHNDKRAINIITKIKIESTLISDMRKELMYKAEASISRLGLGAIYGLLLHNYEALERFGKDLVNEMMNLVRNRIIDKIGVSVYDENELSAASAYDAFEIFQGPVNIFDHNIHKSGLIERLYKQKRFFFARSVFLQGLFFLDDTQLAEKLPSARPYIERLRRLSEDNNISVKELAFLYVNSIKCITSIVLGVKSVSQLKDCVAIAGKALPDRLIRDIEMIFADVPEVIHDPRTWSNSLKK